MRLNNQGYNSISAEKKVPFCVPQIGELFLIGVNWVKKAKGLGHLQNGFFNLHQQRVKSLITTLKANLPQAQNFGPKNLKISTIYTPKYPNRLPPTLLRRVWVCGLPPHPAHRYSRVVVGARDIITNSNIIINIDKGGY